MNERFETLASGYGLVEGPTAAADGSLFYSDGRDLIVVSADNTEAPERGGSVFRTRSDVAGAPVHPARV